MKITLIGSGYVGLVAGACLAELGNSVVCLDVDADKIPLLDAGGVPIHEPRLDDLIARKRVAGRLSFSTDVAAAVAHGEIQVIAVGTPADDDGSADLRHVLEAARNIDRHLSGFKVVVNKSTVPVGTAAKVSAAIAQELNARGFATAAARPAFALVSNPEFLKEGAAVEDFMRPDRIVVGVDGSEAGARALALM